ncbi:MAG: hypothetical protein AB8B55_09630 [Mariniblastus sp.]
MAFSLALSGCKKNATAPSTPNVAKLADSKPKISNKETNQKTEKPAEKTQVTAKKPPLTYTRNGLTYDVARLHKNHTLLVLAYEPDIRASHMFFHLRNVLSPEQAELARKIAISYEPGFQEIIRKRADILENARDDDPELQTKLLNLKLDIADLTQAIRSQIFQDVLTAEQKKNENQKTADREAQQLLEEAKKLEKETLDKAELENAILKSDEANANEDATSQETGSDNIKSDDSKSKTAGQE